MSPIKYHGGKSYLAEWIISLMPEHTHYVETCFGGGSVLFRKPCEGVSEVANDINAELMNFWSVIKDEESVYELKQKLELTPFSEAAFKGNKAEGILAEVFDVNNDFIARAARFFVRFRMSRQGLGKDFATLSRNRTRRGMNEQVSSWLSAIEGLPEAHERLKRVVILNRDLKEVIKSQDGPNTLFYIDTPYVHSTRVTKGDYDYEMTDTQHFDMLKQLSRIKGKFLLSGYHCPMYDGDAERFGWTCHEREIDNKASSKKVKETKTECVWTNF